MQPHLFRLKFVGIFIFKHCVPWTLLQSNNVQYNDYVKKIWFCLLILGLSQLFFKVIILKDNLIKKSICSENRFFIFFMEKNCS
jgi:hypothetical protein